MVFVNSAAQPRNHRKRQLPLHFDNVLACFDYLHLIDNLTSADVDLLFGLGVLYLTRKRRDD